jgi:penicillin-insensitive murein endopeptidase
MIRTVLSILLITGAAGAEPRFCSESPLPAQAASVGRPSAGALRGGVKLEVGAFLRLLPRQAQRCIDWGTPRLVAAIERAASAVAQALPSPVPLGVGDLSRARGGPIWSYSRSHQSGRDADLAFFLLDERGRPVAADDLVPLDSSLRGVTPDGARRFFDVVRNWRLVRALLADPGIHVRWLFISNPLRAALLAEARHEGTPQPLLARAAQVLHQPSDAPPHADHLHLRITCEPRETRCRD